MTTGSQGGKGARRSPAARLIDLWVIFLLASPVYGTFYPLESYLSLGQGEGLTGFATLPIPVTSITLVLVTVSAGFLLALARRNGPFRHDPLAYTVFCIACLSALWSQDAVLTILRALRYIPVITLSLILPQLYGRRRCLELMTIAFVVAAGCSIFMAVLVPSVGLGRLGGGYESSWRGAMVHKNQTGAVFAIGLLVVYAALTSKAVSARLGLVAFVGCFVMVVMSQSGTALGSALIALALALALRAVQRLPVRQRGLVTVALVFASLTLGLLAVAGADAVIGAAGRDMTFTGRTTIWAVIWDLISARPILGYGYAFWNSDHPAKLIAWRQIGDTAAHSHNSWLDLWLQLGLTGLLAVVAMTIGGFVRSARLTLKTGDAAAPALFGLAMLLLSRSMTEVQYTEPFNSILFFLIWIRTFLRMPEPAGAVAASPATAVRQGLHQSPASPGRSG